MESSSAPVRPEYNGALESASNQEIAEHRVRLMEYQNKTYSWFHALAKRSLEAEGIKNELEITAYILNGRAADAKKS